jgi:hypothetical protein
MAFTLPLAPAILPILNRNSTVMDYDIHECKIGKYTGKIFRDLMFKYLGKDYFINASTEEVRTELNRYQQVPDNIPSPFIALLLENGSEKILIDTGIGFSKDPLVFRGNTYQFKGRLLDMLEKEKIDKSSITHVILTHLHPDHIGGIYDDAGRLNFPNAKFFVHEAEWKYWHSSQSDKQPPLFRYFIENNISGLKQQSLEQRPGAANSTSHNRHSDRWPHARTDCAPHILRK